MSIFSRSFLRSKETIINNYYNDTEHTMNVSKNEKGEMCVAVDGKVLSGINNVKFEVRVVVEFDSGDTVQWFDKDSKFFTSFCKIDNDEFKKIQFLL